MYQKVSLGYFWKEIELELKVPVELGSKAVKKVEPKMEPVVG